MKETAEITLCAYQARRKIAPYEYEYSCFVTIDDFDTSQLGPQPDDIAYREGWNLGMQYQKKYRCIVELPEGVHYGHFMVANVHCLGFYGDEEGHDGNGCAVYITSPLVQAERAEAVNNVMQFDLEPAFEKAIQMGVQFHVPHEKGLRTIVDAPIIHAEVWAYVK